ncbi:8-oxo-dGTP diphosphatase MutT [Polynucleobacter kasalickyi]|uniref:8-oxo-dGTP diphosphatase n=1 Tax=Polynucleobacter kasalickyi TaxID=1938817 RepID=A0A1W2ACY5_9BURK|nr:8-oxo-dGTP diphosphatase MutT [Polynucleobacter kasalickyi]SMC58585.1 8-oxo-dGTPase [Polynucleobacter kasalickyi]
MTRPITEVAVGIILRENNDYLLANRPIGKPYAGYWEFPGGKIEQGESPHQALVRELEEELGIQVHQSHAFGVIEHDYPHAYVRLHLHLVKDWTGVPSGLENQELNWQASRVLTNCALSPLLPATISIIEMMQNQGV